jgi:trans-2,3-dihydro-3-hydroxyanthranilate isomerase
MKSYRVIYLDAFTSQPFAGNPCAVLPDARGLTDEQMQAIARETNLSETAFVFPSDKADFAVRYFTPRYELPFAGHPTIATSFMLALEGMVALQKDLTTIQLEFKVGVLPVEIQAKNGKPQQAVMTQKAPVFTKTFSIEETAPCFGLSAADFRSDCPIQVVSTGVAFLIIPVANLEVLKKVCMDRELLGKLTAKADVNAAFMFCLGGFDSQADTHARLFDPHGTMEDPYTGSAAGCMGAYVVHYGLKKGPYLYAEQGHFVQRPGLGTLEIQGKTGDVHLVKLGGAAVKVLDGQIFI